MLVTGVTIYFRIAQNKTVLPPHIMSTTPTQFSILAESPINIVIDTDLDLAENSAIRLYHGGNEYRPGSFSIDENKLAMRRTMLPDAPDGEYTVNYTACHIQIGCEDGQFSFRINRSLAERFENHLDQSTVNITMKDLAFTPRNIRVSRGTTITWKNDDFVGHYINTDPHPAHTYYLPLNSSELPPGGKYAITLDSPGIYLYHCSAHAGVMTGTILVE